MIRRWVRVAGLLAALSFPATAFAAPPPTQGPGSAPTQGLAVLANGAFQRVALGSTASVPALAGTTHWWVWSEQRSAIRVDGPDPGRVTADPSSSDLSDLEIHLPRGAEGAALAGELVVAPAAMWEEVPESLLPRWPARDPSPITLGLPGKDPVRLRWIGASTTSEWIDLVPGAVQRLDLKALPAFQLTSSVRGENGPLPAPADFAIVRPVKGEDRTLAFWRSDERGNVATPPLLGGPYPFRVGAPDHVSRYFYLKSSRVPRRIVLEAGCSLSLRVLDPKGDPTAGAQAVARASVSEFSTEILERTGVSDERGQIDLPNFPRTRVALEIGGKGLATRRELLDLSTCQRQLDLGRFELSPGRDISLTVVNDIGKAVAGAIVRGSAGQSGTSDAAGALVLRALDTTSAAPVSASAKGHVPLQTSIAPEKRAARLQLERQSAVKGRFLDSSGGVPEDPSVKIYQRSRFRTHTDRLETDGRFVIYMEPRAEAELEFTSATSRPVRKAVSFGPPGHVQDLGTIRADSGVSVRGRLLLDPTGEPVAGASILCPKSGEASAVVAWVTGELLHATSRSDGTFVLSGLENRPIRMRVQAAGLGPLEVEVVPDPGVDELDLGDLWLSRGVTLKVTSDLEEAVARVDPRRQWNEIDMLQAQLLDGEAYIDAVPAGRAIVSVVEAGKLRCDREVEIPSEVETYTVDCPSSHILVQGIVTLGQQPAGPGHLAWTAPQGGDAGSLIMKSAPPNGLERESIYGAGRPQVDVAVGADGHYETGELAAGEWSVLWFPATGGTSQPLRTQVPEAPEVILPLDFSAGAILGLVVDEEGAGVPGARVRDVQGTAMTFTAGDGSFSLVGLAPGRAGIQATLDASRSEIVEVAIVPGVPTESVRLVLRDDTSDEVAISTLLADGRPTGALVALETQGQPMRLLTTRADGTISSPVAGLADTPVRAAALINGSWTLGDWVPLDAARAAGIDLTESPGGTLVVRAGEQSGNFELQSASGWSMTMLYRLMGVRMALDGQNPVVVAGLPLGEYSITFEGALRTIALERAESLEVDLAATSESQL